MSNYIVLSLMAKQHDDAEKLAVRAIELLKELDPKNEHGVRFDLYKTRDGREEGINYDSYVPEQIDLAYKVIEGVVATFPEMKLRYYMTLEGPLAEAGESKNGKLMAIELWQTVVHLDNEEDYQRVQAYLQTIPEVDLQRSLENHSTNSLGWEFDQLTENEKNDRLLQRLSEHFPDMTIRCLKYDVSQEQHGDIAASLSLSTLQNGNLHWTMCSPELTEMLSSFAVRNIEGISAYEDIVFHYEQIPQAIKDEAHAEALASHGQYLNPEDKVEGFPF